MFSDNRADLFISHVEEDLSIALNIHQEMEKEGYSTWLYERDGLPGVDFLNQITQAILNAKAMILIVSTHSMISPHVHAELFQAYNNRIKVIPLLAGVTFKELQEKKLDWCTMLGAAVAVEIPSEGIGAIRSRIIRGLTALGIYPTTEAANLEDALSSNTVSPVPQCEAGDLEKQIGFHTIQLPIGNSLKTWILVSQGGWAYIYRDEESKVALKILLPENMQKDPAARARFSQEFQIMKSLKEKYPFNTNLIQVYEQGTIANLPFFTMEFVQGMDLADVIADNCSLHPDLILQVLRALLPILKSLHDEKYLYRDLTPENILIQNLNREDGLEWAAGKQNYKLIRLVDFNSTIHKECSENKDFKGFFGKPMYVPPELWMIKPYTEESDIYQLGVLCYELATGHPPFLNQEIKELIRCHLYERPKQEGLPTVLRDTILKMLEKDPSLRPTLAEIDQQLFCGNLFPKEESTTKRRREPTRMFSRKDIDTLVKDIQCGDLDKKDNS